MDGNFDPVEHPSHYTDGRYEVIDFIEGYGLGFHLGNAVKYICRAGKKDPNKEIEDLKKAIWYLRRAIHSPLFCSARTISLNNTMYIIPVRAFCADKNLSAFLSKAIEYVVDARDFEACHMAIRLIEQHIRENIAGIPSQGYPAVNSIKKLILNDRYNDIHIEKQEETHE